MADSTYGPPQTPGAPGSVIAAFIAGETAAAGADRCVCRWHDTEGPILMLLRDTRPLAVRWEREGSVRVDVLNSLEPATHAAITRACRIDGIEVRPAVEWQLTNVQRSRSVPCEEVDILSRQASR